MNNLNGQHSLSVRQTQRNIKAKDQYCERHGGLPAGIKRTHLMRALNETSKSLGLGDGALRLIEWLLNRTQDRDYLKNKICAVWPLVHKMADGLEVSPRTINRRMHELTKAGLIAVSVDRNGKRHGKRDQNGDIVYCSGISLAPLINRAEEIFALAKAQRRECIEKTKIRHDLNKLQQKIVATNHAPFTAAANELLPRHRPSEIRCINKLRHLRAGLAKISGVTPPSEAAEESGHPSDINVRPYRNNKYISNIMGSGSFDPRTPIPLLIETLALPSLKGICEEYLRSYPDTSLAISEAVVAYADAEPIGCYEPRLIRDLYRDYGEERTIRAFLLVDRNRNRHDSYRVDKPSAALACLLAQQKSDPTLLLRLQSELASCLRNQKRADAAGFSRPPP